MKASLTGFYSLAFLLFLFFLLVSSGCENSRKPIEIGYVGGLTGRVAGLGIAGRDGALLAVEEVNAAGGIDGRSVTLIVKDDKQDAEEARRVVRELVEKRVVAIVGHMTSSMSAATLPLVNEAKVVMVSPTSKSDLFSGKDDYFLRVTAASSANARRVADLSCGKMGLQRFAVIYDVNNRAFTESWKHQFQAHYEELGGRVVTARDFISGAPGLSFYDLVKETLSSKPDAMLILASALDTALIMQQLAKFDSGIPVFASEWSFTSDVLNFGGKAVEGLTSFHSFNSDSTRETYLEYKNRFLRRFGYEPSFASVLSYDAMKLLVAGLRLNSDPGKVKQSILAVGRFPGLQSDIELDRNGDVTRELFHTVITDGKFKIID